MSKSADRDGMNCEAPLANYISNVLNCVNTHKVLYLDEETRGIVAQLYSQSEALERNVFLIHQLGVAVSEQTHSNLAHLSAIVLVRPTTANIDHLKEHLENPKHANYYLFFTNQLEEHQLSQLAQVDESEVVQQVQEYYCDFFPVNRDLWTLQLERQISLYEDEKTWTTDNHRSFKRQLDGLSAFLLSVKKKPIIRYQKKSHLAFKMADSIYKLMDEEKQLFGWTEPDNKPILLILDRKDDPITPLLTQWTYQAMVHELLTIKNSRVDMKHTNPKNKDYNELVLNVFDRKNDAFFNKHLNATFGDLGSAVKKMVDTHTEKMKKNKNLKSVQDMQKFVENYGDFLSQSGMVSKHVAILTELSNLVHKNKLLELSEIEQEIVCNGGGNNNSKEHFKEVERCISNPNIQDKDKIRLSIIYCLRYENKTTNISKIRNLLRDNLNEINKENVQLIDVMLRQFGSSNRSVTLFPEEKENIMQKFKRTISGVQGVENVFTQHNPLLHNVLEQTLKMKLPLTEYPIHGDNQQLARIPPNDIIIYMCGGVCFEENLTVTTFNQKNRGVNIVLGSGYIHNSQSFLDDVKNTFVHTRRYG